MQGLLFCFDRIYLRLLSSMTLCGFAIQDRL
jgi:hypothetical protein